MNRTRRRTAIRPPSQHHELLGVGADASPATIKQAYRQLAAAVHPDTNPGDPAAAERFRSLTFAYRALLEEACDHGDESAVQAHDPAPDSCPTANSGTTAPDVSGRTGDRIPVELPATVTGALLRLLLAIPGVWATQGFPGITGQVPTVSGPRALAGLSVLFVGWWLAGIVLWSRSPAVPEKLAAWRSPGWDGTALLVRLLTFYVFTFGSALVLLSGATEHDGLVWWQAALFVAVASASWVLSGHIPARMGYRSRYDRYWLTGSLPPRSEK